MKKIDWFFRHPYFALILRIFVGGILTYAGFLKMIDMEGMAEAIQNYQILPFSIVNIFGIILPPIEFLTGLCLMFGFFFEGALLVATMLLVVFCLAIETAILRGLDIECGCSLTTDAEIVGIKVLLRDVFLLLCTLAIGFARNQVWMLDSFFPWGRKKESSSSTNV